MMINNKTIFFKKGLLSYFYVKNLIRTKLYFIVLLCTSQQIPYQPGKGKRLSPLRYHNVQIKLLVIENNFIMINQLHHKSKSNHNMKGGTQPKKTAIEWCRRKKEGTKKKQ